MTDVAKPAGDDPVQHAGARPRTLDVHAHFLPPPYREALRRHGFTTLDGGVPVPEWSSRRALDIMDELGIQGAVLSVSSPHVSFLEPRDAVSLCREVNDAAAEICRQEPTRFGACAILPLPDVAASLAELAHALGRLQLDGVALPTHATGCYLGDPAFTPLLEALNDRGATVFIHPTSPCCFETLGLGLPAGMMEFTFETTRTAVSLLYSGALVRFPRIRFILPHAGGTLPFLAPRITSVGAIPILGERTVPQPRALQLLRSFWYDTALSTTPGQIRSLRELVPVSQIVYGSDFPFATEARLRMAEAEFSSLGFTAEEQAAVRFGNAEPLFESFCHRCVGR